MLNVARKIDREFAIAQHALIDNNITPEEKEKLQWKYLDTVGEDHI